jgi:hypothetical protein
MPGDCIGPIHATQELEAWMKRRLLGLLGYGLKKGEGHQVKLSLPLFIVRNFNKVWKKKKCHPRCKRPNAHNIARIASTGHQCRSHRLLSVQYYWPKQYRPMNVQLILSTAHELSAQNETEYHDQMRPLSLLKKRLVRLG